MPSRDDMNDIVSACCRANATLYVIGSNSNGLRLTPQNCTNHSVELPPPKREYRTHLRSRVCSLRPPKKRMIISHMEADHVYACVMVIVELNKD